METLVESIASRHGPHEGEGKIVLRKKDGKVIELEYRYHDTAGGKFHGSISMWDPSASDMELTAYLSRELPTREAMINWVMEKAGKLAED